MRKDSTPAGPDPILLGEPCAQSRNEAKRGSTQGCSIPLPGMRIVVNVANHYAREGAPRKTRKIAGEWGLGEAMLAGDMYFLERLQGTDCGGLFWEVFDFGKKESIDDERRENE